MASAHNAPVLVIGLGRFGSAVAAQLRLQNKEVLAIEKDPELVQKWSGVLTHVVSADATDIDTLHQLGADDFGSAVVGVGTSVEASVLITANLVDIGVERIWAKAITPAHGKILERIGAHHVVYPEADAGRRASSRVDCWTTLSLMTTSRLRRCARRRKPMALPSPSRISAPSTVCPWSVLSRPVRTSPTRMRPPAFTRVTF